MKRRFLAATGAAVGQWTRSGILRKKSFSQIIITPHCGTIQLTQAQLSAAAKVQLGLEIQSLLNCPFLTLFSKIYRPTKVDVLGTWEVGICFKNAWPFFFCFVPGTLKWLLMPLKWHQSSRHHIFPASFTNEPALYWQLLKISSSLLMNLELTKNITRGAHSSP